MRHVFDTALGRDLRLCPTCRRPFVGPRRVLARHDDGDRVVELACANCGWWAIERHAGARLSLLEEALDRDSAQIEAAAQALALSVELERIDNFAAALHSGYILPEDFRGAWLGIGDQLRAPGLAEVPPLAHRDLH